MRLRYWFLLIVFFVGLVLFVLGLYYVYVGGESEFGIRLALVGVGFWGVLLAVGMFYVARVYVKILRDASKF
jgi:hypothetical protein